MSGGFYEQVVQGTADMVTNFRPVFEGWGMFFLKSAAGILVTWECGRVALQISSGSRIPAMLVQIMLTYAALKFYSTPIPIAGKTFTHVITDAGLEMAKKIDTASEEAAGADMATTMATVNMSSWSILTDSAKMIRYMIIFFCMGALQVAALAIIGFGFVAVGTLVLIGPVLIPFNLVPGFEWIAWGWLRSLIQYSMYPLFGNAFIFVFFTVWASFFGQFSGPDKLTALEVALPQVMIFSLSGIFGILKIPQLCAGTFSGSSGVSAMPGIGWWR